MYMTECNLYLFLLQICFTVMILNFWTDRLGKQCILRSDFSKIRVFTVCYSICIIWRCHTMVEPLILNLRDNS